MPAHDRSPNGAPCWVELFTSVPSHWTVYFGVADADAACADVPQLGGAVVEAPMDTPYGRIATATDPTGTLLRIVTA